jgi:hypothetical protein
MAPSGSTVASRGTTTTTMPASDQPIGVEARAFFAAESIEVGFPNTYGSVVRQLGDEHMQTAIQTGWTLATHGGRSLVFGRVMFDLLSWQKRADGDFELSALSPTLDVGVAPLGKGICVSASATWDVHYNAPDRALAGLFVGLCGDAKK